MGEKGGRVLLKQKYYGREGSKQRKLGMNGIPNRKMMRGKVRKGILYREMKEGM